MTISDRTQLMSNSSSVNEANRPMISSLFSFTSMARIAGSIPSALELIQLSRVYVFQTSHALKLKRRGDTEGGEKSRRRELDRVVTINEVRPCSGGTAQKTL